MWPAARGVGCLGCSARRVRHRRAAEAATCIDHLHVRPCIGQVSHHLGIRHLQQQLWPPLQQQRTQVLHMHVAADLVWHSLGSRFPASQARLKAAWASAGSTRCRVPVSCDIAKTLVRAAADTSCMLQTMQE